MRLVTHLVAMPWASPFFPSIQIACLKAYVDRELGDRVETHTYSAFLEIPFLLEGRNVFPFYESHRRFEENPYLKLCLDELGVASAEERQLATQLPGALPRLREATDKYIERRIVPNLAPDAINVIGFTLNYHQVYSSIYCASQLARRYGDRRLLFVFGGMSASLPEVVGVLRRFRLDGLYTIGEGERKLEAILRSLLEPGDPEPSQRLPRIASSIAGVYRIGPTEHLYERNARSYESQVAAISTLPHPDYREYFERLRGVCRDDTVYALLQRDFAKISVEGTRGCFAKCDFCSFNQLWSGFRKSTPEKIVADVLQMVQRYGVERVNFVDNVCDTWAEAYADELIRRRVRIAAFMELRAHHPEGFWTRLALAGVDSIQIGVEALAPPLMRSMEKGTSVIQNLRAQKYLAELGIQSGANLITCHPRSTADDVAATRALLEVLPHYPLFNLSRFGLALGSPLSDRLSLEERHALRPAAGVPIPGALGSYVVSELYHLPVSLALPDPVRAAWDEFHGWYESEYRVRHARQPRLTVTRAGEERLIVHDSRGELFRRCELTGDRARVYDRCHQGPRLETLLKDTGLPEARLRELIDQLQREGVLLEIEGHYLSIAFRPRDELVQNWRASLG